MLGFLRRVLGVKTEGSIDCDSRLRGSGRGREFKLSADADKASCGCKIFGGPSIKGRVLRKTRVARTAQKMGVCGRARSECVGPMSEGLFSAVAPRNLSM
jgi:hypothetical protein